MLLRYISSNRSIYYYTITHLGTLQQLAGEALMLLRYIQSNHSILVAGLLGQVMLLGAPPCTPHLAAPTPNPPHPVTN